MVDSTDHVTGKTGLTPTVTISKNGGSFATPAGAVTEISAGWYKVAGNATDNATLGPLALHATGTAADPTDTLFEVVVDDLTTVALRPTTAGRTLDVASTGEAGLDVANISTLPAGGVPALSIVDSGTAQSATSTTLVLRAGAAFANSELVGATVFIPTATAGAGQSRVITANVGSTDTVTVDAWTTIPTGTITYVIIPTPPASATALPGVNVVQISGDPDAADNAESFFDGTGYAGTGNVIPSVTAVGTVTTVTTVNNLAAGVITAASIAADAITAAKVADGTIDAATFAAGAVNAAAIATGAITSAKFAASAIDAAAIAVDAIGATKIATGAITAAKFAAGAIDAAAIANGAIDAATFAAGAVDAAALAADAGTEIAAAVLAAATTTPIAADIQKVNAVTIVGDGSATPWGP